MATSTLLSYNFHHPFRQNPRVNHVATVIPKFSSPKSISLTLSHTFKHSTLKEAFQSLMSLSLTYPFSFQFSHHDAFSVVLDLWGSEKAVLQGQQVHALLVKTCGLCDSMFLGTKLVHMYGKCGFFSDTQKVFDRMPDRTVFTWNAMLGACVSSGKHVKALELFTEMRVKGVDTPGAYADLKSEELGQGEAIAHNLRTMFGLKVPIVTVVTGEGGSGGALAIACANKLFMHENSIFYIARLNSL